MRLRVVEVKRLGKAFGWASELGPLATVFDRGANLHAPATGA
jgi:hypothetical protein